MIADLVVRLMLMFECDRFWGLGFGGAIGFVGGVGCDRFFGIERAISFWDGVRSVLGSAIGF